MSLVSWAKKELSRFGLLQKNRKLLLPQRRLLTPPVKSSIPSPVCIFSPHFSSELEFLELLLFKKKNGFEMLGRIKNEIHGLFDFNC